MNRRKFIVFLILISTVWYLSGCDYREIVQEKPGVGVYFQIDWSDFPGEELPTGVSIYCYPKNGKMPYIYKSNEIYEVEADMPPGIYDILVFNQVEAEFETLMFSGMDKYSTAKVTIREGQKPRWKLAEDQPVLQNPEWFALDCLPDFEVTEEMFYGGNASYIYLKPKSMVYTALLVFQVWRVEKIYKTYGEMTGLASSIMLGGGNRTGTASIQLFQETSVNIYPDYPEVGEVAASFRTFGIPDDENLSGKRDAEKNKVHFRFLLVDMSTYSNFVFDVGDRIEMSDSTMTMLCETGHGSYDPQDPSWNADPDRPGILPDVEPVTPGAGFDARIGQWGDEVIIDL